MHPKMKNLPKIPAGGPKALRVLAQFGLETAARNYFYGLVSKGIDPDAAETATHKWIRDTYLKDTWT